MGQVVCLESSFRDTRRVPVVEYRDEDFSLGKYVAGPIRDHQLGQNLYWNLIVNTPEAFVARAADFCEFIRKVFRFGLASWNRIEPSVRNILRWFYENHREAPTAFLGIDPVREREEHVLETQRGVRLTRVLAGGNVGDVIQWNERLTRAKLIPHLPPVPITISRFAHPSPRVRGEAVLLVRKHITEHPGSVLPLVSYEYIIGKGVRRIDGDLLRQTYHAAIAEYNQETWWTCRSLMLGVIDRDWLPHLHVALSPTGDQLLTLAANCRSVRRFVQYYPTYHLGLRESGVLSRN